MVGCGPKNATEERLSEDGQYVPFPKGELTFAEHIAPIIYDNCSGCHRADQNAPFALLTFGDVSKRAKQIAEVTASGYMPPWLADAPRGTFHNDRRLTVTELGMLQQWIAEGAAEGAASQTPKPPVWPEDWSIGEPDLVVTMPEPYTLAAEGPDVYRNFVIPVEIDEPVFVRAYEFDPGNARVVHHAVIQVDTTTKSRELDAEDQAPGFGGIMPLSEAHLPDGHFLGWTPGREPDPGTEGVSWRLLPGMDLVLQLHLQTTGKPEPVQSRIALYFTEEPPSYPLYALVIRSKHIDIPADDDDHIVRRSYPLPVDVNVLNVYPHAHYLGKRLKGMAHLPDGKSVTLIDIPQWDFNWQDEYRFAEPKFLPQGTVVEIEYHFDNSSENVFNPNDPPQPVSFGQQSTDEMAELMLQVVTKSAEDLYALDEHGRYTALRDEIEVLIPQLDADPTRLDLHNQVAVYFTRLGDFANASVHLDFVTQQEKTEENVGELAFAASALGELLYNAQQYDEALSFLEKGLAWRQEVGDAMPLGQTHLLLGQTKADMDGDPEEIEEHFRIAHELRPEDAVPANEYAWRLLVNHTDDVDVAYQSEAIAKRAVEISEGMWPAALETLAAARFQLGDRGSAKILLERAIALSEQAGDTESASALRDRLALVTSEPPSQDSPEAESAPEP